MALNKREPKPAPWDYNKKSYNFLHSLYDRTTKRFDENTKVIVVEGPCAAGKSALAKQLATDLNMSYYPEANQDMVYINDYGYDTRKLDPQIPEDCRSFDINNFLINPRHRLTACFQILQYSVKYSQYIDALAHLLSTGQGVVLDRSPYSDFVFVEAMYKAGYMSRGARSAYYDIRKNSIVELLRPHLVVYLDVPVPKVMENIKKRALPYECNSPALTKEYLQSMEDTYKQQYLSEISRDAELLVYDWSNGGDTDVVIEDIEQIDFDRFDEQDTQMRDWRLRREEEWSMVRNQYADKKEYLMCHLNVPRFDVPELVTEADDILAYRNVLAETPGMRYLSGFDAAMGDENILFKSPKHRETLPKRERRTDFSGI